MIGDQGKRVRYLEILDAISMTSRPHDVLRGTSGKRMSQGTFDRIVSFCRWVEGSR